MSLRGAGAGRCGGPGIGGDTTRCGLEPQLPAEVGKQSMPRRRMLIVSLPFRGHAGLARRDTPLAGFQRVLVGACSAVFPSEAPSSAEAQPLARA